MKRSLFLIFFFLPTLIFAQSVSLHATYSAYSVGDSALVTVSVNSGGQNINTVSGTVAIPDGASVSSIRSGNSVISLWVNKPAVSGNTITFTGGMPGGFSGSGQLFSFLVNISQPGNLSFSLSDVHVLLNDGSGNEISNLKLGSLSLSVSKIEAKPKAKAEVQQAAALPTDTAPPESFIPLIGRDPSIASGDYFVSFNAVDKGIGISKYQVREDPYILSWFGITSGWNEAQSPYILSYQNWGSTIEVKAIDGAGNSTIGTTEKSFSNIMLAVIGMVLIVVTIILTRRFSKPSYRVVRRK